MFRDGQRDSKRAALAFFTFETDVAAMRFDSPAGNRQAEAGTTPFPRSCFIDSVKAVEDVRLMFTRNSGSLVDHVQAHLLFSRTLYADENLASCGRIFNGVIQQIDDGLAQNEPVYRDDEACVTLDVNM